jgi:hypothetical protein
MTTQLLWLVLAATILAKPGTAGPEETATNQRRPVLVELFTSEGCSSCPPADALLEKLDREQPVSAAAFTARQETYDRRFGLSGPYTPEMVVDGVAEFNGSDAQKAESAIRQAIADPPVGVRIRAGASGDAGVTIEVDPLPDGKTHKANVYVAYAADSGTSDVLRGENQGRRLHHVAIVRDIQQVGTLHGNETFTKQLPNRAGKVAAGSRLIVFVQEAGNGRVWGAASKAF